MLLDTDVSGPDLERPKEPTAESIQFVAMGPDRMTLGATTTIAGLVAPSEVYESGWRSHVDGEQVPVYSTFRALQVMPVPAGTHTIDLRCEVPGLNLGLVITVGTVTTVAIVLVWRQHARRPFLVG